MSNEGTGNALRCVLLQCPAGGMKKTYVAFWSAGIQKIVSVFVLHIFVTYELRKQWAQ